MGGTDMYCDAALTAAPSAPLDSPMPTSLDGACEAKAAHQLAWAASMTSRKLWSVTRTCCSTVGLLDPESSAADVRKATAPE